MDERDAVFEFWFLTFSVISDLAEDALLEALLDVSSWSEFVLFFKTAALTILSDHTAVGLWSQSIAIFFEAKLQLNWGQVI